MDTSRRLAIVAGALASVTLALASEDGAKRSPELKAEVRAARGLTGEDKGRNWHDYPDFSSLRQEIGWRDDFSNICESDPPFNKIGALIRDGKPSEAANLGRGWLEQCPVDIRVHHLTFSEGSRKRFAPLRTTLKRRARQF